MSDPLVLIPSRLGATRLPNKPLADICGEPMIVHVWRRAVAASIGPVVVAADSPAIIAAVERAGGHAILTGMQHQSGSDRIFEAIGLVDPDRRHDVIVNIQGDLPTIAARSVQLALVPLADPEVDMATLAALIQRAAERDDPNVVKLVGSLVAPSRLRALYFTRATAPWGEGPLYHHIGLYAFKRKALERFVALAPSALEQRERLEQLRALEDNMRIDAMIVDEVPLGVDTAQDLEHARQILGNRT